MRIRARRIVSGRASGTAIVSPQPFSFVGGADPESGVVLDKASGAAGERLEGRIFAFPHGKGSTVGSYIIFGLGKKAIGPAAIVNTNAEAIVAVGATLAEVPMVDRVDTGGLRSGDRMIVDADRETVDLPEVEGTRVVSAIVRNRGRILIVRRSDAVGSFRGRWSAISGYLEGRENPRHRAVQEVREETGLHRLVFRASGEAVLARHEGTIYIVHAFLFDAPTTRIRLDWENVEHRWIRPAELSRFDTVPRLNDVVSSVLPHAA